MSWTCIAAGGATCTAGPVATSINDQGQIVGSLTMKSGGAGEKPGFLLTPIPAYPNLPVRAIDDVLTRAPGEGLEFTAADLTAIIPAPVRLDVTEQLRRTLRRDTSLSVPSAGLVATEQWAAIEPILARHIRDLTTRAALAEQRLAATQQTQTGDTR